MGAERIWAAYRDGEYVCAGTIGEVSLMLERPGLADRLARARGASTRVGRHLRLVALVPAGSAHDTGGEPPRLWGGMSMRDFDRAVWGLHAQGLCVNDIADRVKASPAGVRGSLLRTENGRYGAVARVAR